MKQVAFGKYTLLHRIAQGGMAELFLARWFDRERGERTCAVKLVSSAYAKNASFASMFEDEVRIAASLDHPNIGQVLDVGQAAGHYFLAMEYIHGKDLRAILRRSLNRARVPVSTAMAVAIGIKICAALKHAHEACAPDGTRLKLVHRDVSPSNIMVSYDGQVKLIDFGIAKATGRSSLTMPGTIKGKIRYLSPEQIQGKEIDGRTDLFTLGTSLWEATVGRHLFGGTRPVEIYESVVRGPVPPPSRFVPNYPLALERILLRALAHAPAERYARAADMQRDLEAYAETAGFDCDEAALARHMTTLFPDEVQEWHRAVDEGKSLLDYLSSLAPPQEHEHDLDDVLALQDERTTIPDRPPGEEAAGAAADLEGDTDVVTSASVDLSLPPHATEAHEAADSARKTVLMESVPAEAADSARKTVITESAPAEAADSARKTVITESAPAEARPRRTVAYGEAVRVSPGEGRPPRGPVVVGNPSPSPSAAPAPRRAAAEPQWELRSDGQVDVVLPASIAEESAGAASAARPSAEVAPPAGACPTPVTEPDSQRPTVIEVPSPPGGAPSGPATPGNAPPEPSTIGSALSPAPELPPGEAAAPAEELPPLESPRPRTGDWSHQATGEHRAGTHPYFKELDRASQRHPRITDMSVFRPSRKWVVFVVVGIVALFGLLAALWRPWEPAPAPPPKSGAKGEAELVTVKVVTQPPGATVYNASDGQELGRTPLALPLLRGETRSVELRLEGYDPRSATLTSAASMETITLQPTRR